MITNADMTVYNRYTDATKKDKYNKTMIRAVNWNSLKGATVYRTGIAAADSVKVVIYTVGSDAQGKRYVSPKVYAAASDAERQSYFTFAPDDIIVKGESVADLNTMPLSDAFRLLDDIHKVRQCDVQDRGSLTLQHLAVYGV